MKSDHSVQNLCHTLEVSTSGYYDWLRRCQLPGPRALEDQSLAQAVASIHARSHHTYGSPRIVQELRKEGARHGRNRVARLMHQQGLYGRQRRRYRVCTTDSNHDHPIAPNRLAKALAPTAPNQIWLTDITYIPTEEGWLYLAAVMDLFSRRLVGWAMGPDIDTSLVSAALKMALVQRANPTQVLVHSDRGVQYASGDYRALLARFGLVASMSRKANCYDNAAMESFWSSLKLELVYRSHFTSRVAAKSAIFDYIESFYNRQRSHSSLGFISPALFEATHN